MLLPTKNKKILRSLDLGNWLNKGQSLFDKYGHYKSWTDKNKIESDLKSHYITTIFNPFIFYLIDSIDWDKNLNEIVMKKETVAEYYKRQYNIEINDLDQPLFISGGSKLVPSLCKISNYTIEMNNSLDIFRKFFKPLSNYLLNIIKGYEELNEILFIIGSLTIEGCDNIMIKQLITHRSFVNNYEMIYTPQSDFEQLEKVGDSILECFGSFLCFVHFRQLDGKELFEDHFKQIKSNNVLNEAGRRIKLHYILVCGNDLELNIADLFEALLTFLFYNFSIKVTVKLLIEDLFYGDVIGPLWTGIYTDLKTIDRIYPFTPATEEDKKKYDVIYNYYTFKNINILKNALKSDFERSRHEFLGRAIRKFLIVNYFYNRYPKISNNQLHSCHEGCFNRLQIIHNISEKCGFNKFEKVPDEIIFGQRIASKTASLYDVILGAIFLDNCSDIINSTSKRLDGLSVLYDFLEKTLLRNSDDPDDLPFYYLNKPNELQYVYNYSNGLDKNGKRFCPDGCNCMKYPHGSYLTMMPSFEDDCINKEKRVKKNRLSNLFEMKQEINNNDNLQKEIKPACII